ncbi:hypothetical protein RvY_00988 [Ramazzottius varieornatus]|uniref:Uncharacterized protein n=1 Tax=Ramazzottius varieornatus TaxID=947166 RepID=A0A1D1UEP0_RAMVA|nr:hypothetical protein RvY_00988 [Ramazzottius varieornatus]
MAPHLYEGNSFDQDRFHQQSSSPENKEFSSRVPGTAICNAIHSKAIQGSGCFKKGLDQRFLEKNNRKRILRIWNGGGKSGSGNEIKNDDDCENLPENVLSRHTGHARN